MAKNTTKGTYNKLIALIIGLSLVVFGSIFVNWFVYPFTSATPNYADVEAVYNKLQIPSDWQKIAEGSNKGLAGRQCPVESDGCFSKSGSFRVPLNTSYDTLKEVFKSSGCISVIVDRKAPVGADPYANFECSHGVGKTAGTLKEKDWTLTINVGTN